MMQRSIWRALLAALVCAVGGFGLTNTIFPQLILRFLEEIPLEVLIGVRAATLPIGLLWAVGGAIVGWLGGVRTGGLIMGACGLIGGLILSMIVSPDLTLAMWGMVTGLAYGLPGGLIMGRVFPRPANQA